MNYRLFTDSALAAAQTLYYGWSYKVTLAAILALLLHKHAILFTHSAFLCFWTV